jgi:hypothetical protein
MVTLEVLVAGLVLVLPIAVKAVLVLLVRAIEVEMNKAITL